MERVINVKYSLVIFDLDGTVLDTLVDLKNSLNFSLKAAGFPERTLDETRRFVGNGIRKLIERAVPEKTGAEIIDKIFADFSAHYKIHCADNTKAYEGIYELLNSIKEKNLKTAVVSNKADFAVQELCNRYFPNFFDAAVGEKAGVNKKPSPDSVNAVLKKIGITRDKAVYIGDSEVDIQTAKNANMKCISVDWGFRDINLLKANGAEIIVSKPQDILSLL